MARWLTLLVLLTLIISCGGGGDDETPDDQTATSTGTVTSSTTATVPPSTSTAPVAPSATATTPATTTIELTPTGEPGADLLPLLPTLDDMPEGFAIAEEGYRTEADIAAGWPDPNVMLEQLAAWEFVASAFRSFEIPAPGSEDLNQRMVSMRSSVSLYGSPSLAQEAARGARAMQMAVDGAEMSEASTDQIGDLAIAAQGSYTSNGSTVIVAILYVVVDDVVLAYQGLSFGHDSLPDITTIATQVEGR